MRVRSVAEIFDAVADRLDEPSTVGPYTIRMVDEEDIRDESETLEEFSNYAVHSDFPDEIQEQTIWISEEVPEDERWILIEEAISRIESEADGMDPDDAYAVGIKLSKKLRSRISPESQDIDAEAFHVKLLKTLSDGCKVWLVDGEKIRDSVDVDFVEGGNSYAYGFVPDGEIWIDQEVPAKERPLIIAHEAKERSLMKAGASYEEAHKQASRFEWKLR